jgi:hypothetical protein
MEKFELNENSLGDTVRLSLEILVSSKTEIGYIYNAPGFIKNSKFYEHINSNSYTVEYFDGKKITVVFNVSQNNSSLKPAKVILLEKHYKALSLT